MKQALKGFKADGVHYHLIRMLGVMAFSLALSGFMALGFQNENDQVAYLFGRVVVRTDIYLSYVRITVPGVLLTFYGLITLASSGTGKKWIV